MRRQPCLVPSRTIVLLISQVWMAHCAIHFSSPAHAQNDAGAIRSLLSTTWDKPDGKVETDPVIVSGHHAVASWTQGGHGGRALLRRGEAGWSVVLCSGDPIKSVEGLVAAGVPQPDAERISAELNAAEALIPSERRAKFSLFQGVVTMDSGRDPHSSEHVHDH